MSDINKKIGIIHVVMGLVVLIISVYAIFIAYDVKPSLTHGEFVLYLLVQPIILLMGYDRLTDGIDRIRGVGTA